ncbi:MAG TPA: hypothetical protein VN894_19335 [Polyangiaceae bacterium]|nr:hypothetical protein [Polyangiaceae bacterium]
MSIRRRDLVLAGAVALVFGAAPTVGDIGSCSQPVTDLDPQSFAVARKNVDCQRCTECALTDRTCRNACDPTAPGTAGWPVTCRPLEHDGEVCIRALQAASCSDYAGYVDDAAPTIPTECDFCHVVPEGGIAAGDP